MTDPWANTAPIALVPGERNALRAMRSLPGRALAMIAALAGLLALVTAAAPGTAGAAGPQAKPAAAKRLDARTRTRLGRALSKAMASTWAPGMIVGVWVGDRGWTSARGSTQRAAGPRPVLGEHSRIGSVTKTMTGTLILQLVQEGKLGLDDTIDRWFPEFPEARDITVRDLGSMASGIASYTMDPALTARYFSRPTTVWTPTELIAGAAALPRLFPPGKGFYYSNTNFVMLGRIVEMETGKPLAQVMQSKLFKPLGLRDTSYPTTNRLPNPHWRGYTIQGSENGAALDYTNSSPTFAAGAGQAISTLEDLSRWTRALGTGSLLKPATQRQRLVPNPASVGGGRAYLFALGRDHGWLAHDGDIPGYNAQVAYLPSLKATIVVMANADIGGGTKGAPPAPVVFQALARVIAPNNVPSG